VQGDVDAGEEGFVKGLDTVGGEEEDSSVVLDVSEAVGTWLFDIP